MPTTSDIEWFKTNFGAQIEAALTGLPFDLDMVVAIACQETGYIWSILRRKGLPLDRVIALCVGDTIDYKGPGKGRQAFPRDKSALLSENRGDEMFDIARGALVDMATYVPGYGSAVSNTKKFCHGFGVFQRDLQFFLVDPDYFLEKKYENFDDTLDHCLKELRRGLKKLNYQSRTELDDLEFCAVAIAYNRGSYNSSKGLKQGFFDGTKYYGENIYDYLQLSRAVTVIVAPGVVPGKYVVVARDGLRLRGGPGTNFGSEKTLDTGSTLFVVAVEPPNSSWVRVDLEGDGLLDGYVHSAFLSPTGDENAIEPG